MAQRYLESTFDRDFKTCKNHILRGDTDTEEWSEGKEVRRNYGFVRTEPRDSETSSTVQRCVCAGERSETANLEPEGMFILTCCLGDVILPIATRSSPIAASVVDPSSPLSKCAVHSDRMAS